MIDLNKFAQRVHKNAVAHGWWEEEPTTLDLSALCGCELAEAVERYRSGYAPDEIWFKNTKPEGIAIEVIDNIIRSLDYLAYWKIDIEHWMREKHKYNKTRPYKHGGKVC